jgi:hypothetical protein
MTMPGTAAGERPGAGRQGGLNWTRGSFADTAGLEVRGRAKGRSFSGRVIRAVRLAFFGALWPAEL